MNTLIEILLNAQTSSKLYSFFIFTGFLTSAPALSSTSTISMYPPLIATSKAEPKTYLKSYY